MNSDQRGYVSLFFPVNRRVLVCVVNSDGILERLLNDVLDLGHMLLERGNPETMVRLAHHFNYVRFVRGEQALERFQDSVRRIVCVKNGEENRAVGQLQRLQYVCLAERVYQMRR